MVIELKGVYQVIFCYLLGVWGGKSLKISFFFFPLWWGALEIVFADDLLFCPSSEVKLSLASFLSDRIVDEILEALSGSQNTLVSTGSGYMLVIVQEESKFSVVFVSYNIWIFCACQAEHLVRKGRPLVQQESVDLDVPEVRTSKRNTMELMEAERLEDLESCMVSILSTGFDPEV